MKVREAEGGWCFRPVSFHAHLYKCEKPAVRLWQRASLLYDEIHYFARSVSVNSLSNAPLVLVARS